MVGGLVGQVGFCLHLNYRSPEGGAWCELTLRNLSMLAPPVLSYSKLIIIRIWKTNLQKWPKQNVVVIYGLLAPCFWIKVNHLKYSEKHFFVFSGWRAWVLAIGTKSQIWTQIFLVGVHCLCQFTYLFCSRCSPTPCENFDTGAHILDKTHLSTVHSPLTTSKEAVFVFCAWDQAAPLAGACFLQIFKRLWMVHI